MKDVNQPIKKAVFTALQATGEDVFNSQAPDEQAGNYIVFSSLSASPIAIKSASAVTVNVTVTIFSESHKYNSGDEVDIIAGKVYEQLYPDASFKLPIDDGFSMASVDLVSDNTNSWRLKNQVVSIDRTIIFQFRIYIQ